MYGKILRLLGHLTGLMILGSAGWTAFNVLALLGTHNPVSYAVAGMFDSAWLIAVAVQHELRYRVDWRIRLAAVSWALAGLAAAINATSELLGGHGVAVAVIAAIVPPLAKGCLALKLLLETNSPEAKDRFTTLTQSWADQVTELRINEAMAGEWHRVERVHENADAQRLAVTQSDRLANLELTSGTELPVTRTADPVVWEKPVTMPLAPVFQEPAPVVVEPAETVPVPRTPFGFARPVADATAVVEPQVAPTVAALSQEPAQAVPEAFAERTEAARRRRADGIAYMRDNPDAVVAEIAKRFGVSTRTVQRWWQTQDEENPQ
ncbi:hypothetical protein [Streptacidiphilus anmyonensis]|uniref:hypothetical protein n=1 Tax=Streptacidiphilus anmyonensis TaxID=405782 RepID=UPI0005A85F51|nr:hypothetical protein [Streptacidiphilus anmyonensis]